MEDGQTAVPDEATPDPVWQVPTIDGAHVELVASPGYLTCLVGANGAGKSALGQWLSVNGVPNVHRVIAHRQLWFESAGPDITSAQREQLEGSIRSWTSSVESRWLDHGRAQRTGTLLYDVINRTSHHAVTTLQRIKDGESPDVAFETAGPSLLDRLNTILSKARIALTLSSTDQGTLVANPVSGAPPYPISQMSDGEKSALLLAAEVLTVPPNSAVVIDEPERHLHRSISAPLIEAVLADRPDCHFVVLTHDLDLAASLPPATSRLGVVAAAKWVGQSQAVAWDLEMLVDDGEIPETARRAILGGRRQLLFVEGSQESLDRRFYEILFPDWSVTAAGGCDEVTRIVAGLGDSGNHHWVMARGIVDGDGRTAEERATLAQRGVLALPVCEVESVYYSEVVRRAIAARQAETIDADTAATLAESMLTESTQAGLAALLQPQIREHLASTVALKQVRRELLAGVPAAKQLAEAGVGPVTVSMASPFPELLNRLNEVLDDNDLESAVLEYPVRDSGLKGAVAKALKFDRVDTYEAAARARIAADANLRAAVVDAVGEIPV